MSNMDRYFFDKRVMKAVLIRYGILFAIMFPLLIGLSFLMESASKGLRVFLYVAVLVCGVIICEVIYNAILKRKQLKQEQLKNQQKQNKKQQKNNK